MTPTTAAPRPPRRLRRALVAALAAAALGVAAYAVYDWLAALRFAADAQELNRRGAIIKVGVEYSDFVGGWLQRFGIGDVPWLGSRTVAVQFWHAGATRDDLRLAAGLPGFHMLDCFGCDALDDDALAELRAAPGLVVVRAFRSRVTDAGVGHLLTLPRLKGVGLTESLVSDEGVRRLRAKPGVEWVWAGGPNVRNVRVEGFTLRGPDGPDGLRLGDTLTLTGRLVVDEPDLPAPDKMGVGVMLLAEGFGLGPSISGTGVLTAAGQGRYDFTATTAGPGRGPGRHAVRLWVEFAARPPVTYELRPAEIDLAPRAGKGGKP